MVNHLVPPSSWFLLQARKIRDERSARQIGLDQTPILVRPNSASPRDILRLMIGMK
jgi:hypothetical protein